MRKICIWSLFAYLLLFSIPINTFAIAGNDTIDMAEEPHARFELKDGDRVVLLGNSLMEYDLQYGYIEFALTSRWPGCDITFRNLGWSGDTVFGDARSYFTSPPNAYDLLIKQLTSAQPTVVFVAYGSNEAYEGEAGLSRFVLGLNQLIDKIDSLGAKTVLLSPIPQMSNGSPVHDVSLRNKDLKLYTSAISKVAADRKVQFIDLFTSLQEMDINVQLTSEGVHLNEIGYYHLVSVIENALSLPSRQWAVNIDISKQHIEANGPVKISDAVVDNRSVKFTLNETFLPLPLPQQEEEMGNYVCKLKIEGLKKGYYTLAIDGDQVCSATAKKWSEGVEIRQGTSFSQAKQLQDQILKKNELYFRQYRPLNRTYLIGFRSYEQGRHVEGLEQLDLIIKWMEGQIAGARKPNSNVYKLTSIQ